MVIHAMVLMMLVMAIAYLYFNLNYVSEKLKTAIELVENVNARLLIMEEIQKRFIEGGDG